MKPSDTTHFHGIPARKNSAHQTMAISMVWPKSGCATSGATTMASSSTANSLPGSSGRLPPSANRNAVRITNAGFRNSAGCTDTPRIDSQRRAPLASSPRNNVAMVAMSMTTNRISATRRTLRLGRNDTATITQSAGMAKKAWRMTKW